MNLKLSSATLAVALVGFTCTALAQRTYTVKRAVERPIIDGIVGDDEWEDVKKAKKFTLLREPEGTKDRQKSEFRITWDDDGMYMLFTSKVSNWATGVGSSTMPCGGELICGDLGGFNDTFTFYVDPDLDDELNENPPDGYQISVGMPSISEGIASYVNDFVTNTNVFKEGHVDSFFGNNGDWGVTDGHTQWQFVATVSESKGTVVELDLPWETWDAQDPELLHNFAPTAGDTWYFNAAAISPDPSNFLPIWNWNPFPAFVARPDGILVFSDEEAIGDGINAISVPEPSSIVLFALGLLGQLLYRRRQCTHPGHALSI